MKTRLYILPFQQKKNEVISLKHLKDMIRYKRSCQYFFCTVSLYDHNYWPYPQTTIKQSGYCSRYSPLFNAY